MLWPFDCRILEVGADLSNSQGKGVLSGAADTKGSWIEFTSSRPMDVGAIMLHIDGNNGNLFNHQLSNVRPHLSGGRVYPDDYVLRKGEHVALFVG